MLYLATLAPYLPDFISHAYTPIFGYYVADEYCDVNILTNGSNLEVSQADRSDLFKVYPGKICKGFHAVYIADRDQQISVVITTASTEIYRKIIPVTPSAREEVNLSDTARLKKRSFAESHMVCAVCGENWTRAHSTCPNCDTQFDQSIRGISAVPLGSYSIPTTINTSCFGYGEKEQAVIDTARQKNGWVLDFGSGLHPRSNDHVICLEIADMPSVDVISVSSRIPFQDNTFDAVISQHVLEHVEKPWEIAKELIRVAKPGGIILSTVPYVCPVHGFPYHFFNMTPDGLRKLFDGMEIISHTMQGDAHPINGIKQLVQVLYGSIGEPFRSQFGAMTINEIVSNTLGSLIETDWAAALPEAAWWEMPAHSTLTVRKPE